MTRRAFALSALAVLIAFIGARPASAALVAYYPLDGDATAVVGPDGVVNGSPLTVSGMVGQALDFNGSTDFIGVGAGAIGGGSYSFAAWVNPEVLTGITYVAAVQQSAANGGRLFRFSGDVPQLQHVAASIATATGSTTPTGSFVHLVGTFNDELNELRFYENGVPVGGPVAMADNSNLVQQNFTIGRRPDSSANFFNGIIDDLAVYSHALSAAEVATIASGGVLALEAQRSAAGPNIAGPYTADANTLHLYHLDATMGDYLDSGNDPRPQNLVGGTRDSFSVNGFGNALTVLASDLGANALTKGASTANSEPQSLFQGADGAFTYEALISVSTLNVIASEQSQIMAREGDGGVTSRSFQFRINNGALELVTLNTSGTQTLNAMIPTTGEDAFVPNEWFHVAVAYDGNEGAADNLSFYWTAVGGDATEANLIGTAMLLNDMTPTDTGIFSIGSMRRGGFRTPFLGSIDEVRISDVARGAGDFIFQEAPPIPEPATASLLLLGLAAAMRRRRIRTETP